MSSLWLITTFFNPLNWSSRRRNYDTFRRHLKANLLTVEWSPNGDFSLREDDADRLVRVSGGELMWQKERLINIGLEHLPDDCDLVGWVDCDILFRDPLWSHRAAELLGDHDVMQLYGTVAYLDREHSLKADPCQACLESALHRPSLIQSWRRAVDPDCFLEQELERRRRQCTGELVAHALKEDCGIAPGLAWAARRAWLEQIGGLPDRAVIGGGDLHAAYGLFNRLGDFDETLQRHGPGAYVSRESLRWVEGVQRTAPRIGHLSGTLLHLHHGDLTRRHYMRRQYDLMGTGFLPDEHLDLDSGGAWRFSDSAPKTVRAVMARYFTSREEDGAAAQS